jgi:hypothetical protein
MYHLNSRLNEVGQNLDWIKKKMLLQVIEAAF